MPSIYILIILLVFVVLALAGFVLSLRRKINDSEKQDAESKNGDITSNISNQIQLLSSSFSASLSNIQKSVDQRLGENTDRLDNASKSYAEVRSQLAKLEEQTQKVFEASKDISSLHDILNAPKLRGVMGEFMLENLLSQKLSKNLYTLQHAFKSGEKVDVVVRLKDYLIPIDSKFPREDYDRLVDAAQAADADGVKKATEGLVREIKKCAKDIREKYISPPDTTEFAIMFLPTEGLYAEVLRQPGLHEQLQHDYHIVPAGPTTLSAVLNSLKMGFQTLAIEKRSSEVWQILAGIKVEFGKFGTVLEKVKNQLSTASKTIDDTVHRTKMMEKKLKKVDQLPSGETANLLQIHGEPILEEVEMEQEEI